MIRAAGGVVWRPGPAGPEVAIVHRPRYGDWSLPKGKLAAGEPHLIAALREVREETGIRGVAGASLGSTAYTVAGERKRVRWWSVRAEGGEFEPGEEVDGLSWLPPADALALLGDAEPLHRWLRLPLQAGLVLLVRHGSAGDPQAWQGSDEDRALDDIGEQQAQLIARVLLGYRPVRVLSAPPKRCLNTVGPLAVALDLALEVDPLIGEEGAPPDPAEHLLGLVTPAEAVVVCSQGGVIPRVLQALLPPGRRIRAAKGSVWALTLHGDRLLHADDDVLI